VVAIEGSHTLGPHNARLTVHTKRTGKVAKAGHDLTIEVTSWEGKLDIGERPSASLVVDSTSFRVREGSGGIQALDDDDKANIEQTIDDEVLLKRKIKFESTDVKVDGNRLTVTGDLRLMMNSRPLTFNLTVGGDGRLSGAAVVKQSDWGMKPYTALFGTLKVADEVEVRIETEPLD
jgi:polyisoprenoid-binding protein YceI